MCQNILNNPTLILAIISLDRELAYQLQKKGCFFCNHPLDAAHYKRKPRGGPTDPVLLREFTKRYSFCCRQCRKRHTSLSVRFLGRRSYLAITIVLACCIIQGASPSRLHKLEQMGIPRQTVHRWLCWWRDEFVSTPVWQTLIGNFLNAKVIPHDPLFALQIKGFRKKLLLWLKHLMPLSVDASVLLRVHPNPQNL